MKRKRVRTAAVAWTPFERCTWWADATGHEQPIPDHVNIVRNSLYTVNVQVCDTHDAAFGVVLWLSIKRNDRAPIHDWRHLQRIKNELAGRETEAVEIYPRESRLVDTSNQFHLWCFRPGYVLPFGYAERQVVDHTKSLDPAAANAVQRPFDDGFKPDDCMTGEQASARMREDPAFGTRIVHTHVFGELVLAGTRKP